MRGPADALQSAHDHLQRSHAPIAAGIAADGRAEGEVLALKCGADGGRSGHQRIKLLRHQGHALLPRPHLPVGLRSERLRLEQTLATSITQGGMQHQRVT